MNDVKQIKRFRDKTPNNKISITFGTTLTELINQEAVALNVSFSEVVRRLCYQSLKDKKPLDNRVTLKKPPWEQNNG